MQIKMVCRFSLGEGGVISTKTLIPSKSPLAFSALSLGASDFLGNGPMILDDMVLLIDLLHPVNSRIS